jgi:hypothetical protein
MESGGFVKRRIEMEKRAWKSLTPLKAIRLRCLDCSSYQVKEVRFCEIESCPICAYRLGKKPKEKPGLTPVKAIKSKCLDCCLGQRKEVVLCPATDCSLYLYRLGRNPRRAGIGARNSPILEKTYG